MSKINMLVDEIPETTHEFTIDLVGRITKKRYLGEFKCKIPTLKDQAMIAKHIAHLNGEFPIYLDPSIVKLHKWIGYLRFTLIDTPLFWRNADLGYELRDDNIIEEVYDQVISFENEWIKTIWGEPTEETDGSAEGETKKEG